MGLGTELAWPAAGPRPKGGEWGRASLAKPKEPGVEGVSGPAGKGSDLLGLADQCGAPEAVGGVKSRTRWGMTGTFPNARPYIG